MKGLAFAKGKNEVYTIQFKKKPKKVETKKESEEENPEEESPFIPVISVNLINDINPVQAVANGIGGTVIKSEYMDLQGKLFIMVSEALGEIKSEKENTKEVVDIAERLMIRKDVGMAPLGVTLGETVEPYFNEPIDVPGYERLRINVSIEKCEDANNSFRNFPLIKLICSDSDVPKEIVLGRGLLAVLNRLHGDQILLVKFNRNYGTNIDINAIKSAIIEMDGPSAVFANPNTVKDAYIHNPIFDEMLFIYNIKLEFIILTSF